MSAFNCSYRPLVILANPGFVGVGVFYLQGQQSMVAVSAARQAPGKPIVTAYRVTWANYLFSRSLCLLTGKMG